MINIFNLLPLFALLYFLGVFLYITLQSIGDSFNIVAKQRYNFVIYEGDKRTEKEKIISEIKYIIKYCFFKIFGVFLWIILFFLIHVFTYLVTSGITFTIFIFLPTIIIPIDYMFNIYTLSILSFFNTYSLLQSKKEVNTLTAFTEKLDN